MFDESQNSNMNMSARKRAADTVAGMVGRKYSKQKDLADEIGVKPKKLYDLLKGRKKMDAALAAALAPKLETSVDYLLDLETTIIQQMSDEARSTIEGDVPDVRSDDANPKALHPAERTEKITNGAMSLEFAAGTPSERIKELYKIALELGDLTTSLGATSGTKGEKMKFNGVPQENKPQKIFVAMPFSEDLADFYQLGVKRTAADQGFVCERVDENEFNGSIFKQISQKVSHSDILIAEITDRNPNVMLEVGMAHGMGKPTILCTRDIANTPSDIRDQNHIVYKNLSSLIEQLERRLKSMHQNEA